MSEIDRIVAIRGEPLSAGRVGVRVRVGLSGCPSVRWSHALRARLAGDLVGQRAVGYLKLKTSSSSRVLSRARCRRLPARCASRSTRPTGRTPMSQPDPPMSPRRMRTRSPATLALGCDSALTTTVPDRRAAGEFGAAPASRPLAARESFSAGRGGPSTAERRGGWRGAGEAAFRCRGRWRARASSCDRGSVGPRT